MFASDHHKNLHNCFLEPRKRGLDTQLYLSIMKYLFLNFMEIKYPQDLPLSFSS